jgi:phospholipid/cholesterol/gamma-HCH transport system ATP-binding protein
MSADQSPPKIAVRSVTKSFGRKHVLRGADLLVPKGQSTVIIGGSGTGKSVLLKCILGLIQPDSGTIEIDGTNILTEGAQSRRDIRQKIGMLFQGGALFDSLRVWENVAFGLMQGDRISAREAKPIAITKLGQVGLGPDVADLFPAELSGGMQKRVGLARAIAREPEILFFDEPTTGLDPIMAGVINDLIRQCVADLGATAVTITHDMTSVRHIADQVAMIYEGKFVWSGPIADLDASGNPYIDQFIHGRTQGPIALQVRGA